MGRSAPTSFIILDAQSVKNTETLLKIKNRFLVSKIALLFI